MSVASLRHRLFETSLRIWSWWPRWTLWGAIVWAAAYAIAGTLWWAGVDWYPFAVVPPERSSSSILEGLPPAELGPMFAIGGALGVVAAAVLLAPTPSWMRRIGLAVALALAVAATAIIPDYIVLAMLAMWPAMVVFAFTGVPGTQGGGIEQVLYPHRLNLIAIFVGGLLWAAASLAEWRRTRHRCPHCGRPTTSNAGGPLACARLRRAGRIFVWLAIISMLPYDLTRVAWFLGWPLGLSDETFRILQDPPWLLGVGLGLALVSTGGAILTHAFVAPWGEAFPRWTGPLAGRSVPVMLAVAPATLVVAALPSAAVMVLRPSGARDFDLEDWGTWLPGLLMVGWAIGLGGAVWAYYRRRRAGCRHCGGSGQGCRAAGEPQSAPLPRGFLPSMTGRDAEHVVDQRGKGSPL